MINLFDKQWGIVGAGDPITVLTTENIASVYGVEAAVRKQSETPYVVPIRPIRTGKKRSMDFRYGIFD